jgi:predicted AlkP superfamily phosphohydrolase/phosphomutase
MLLLIGVDAGEQSLIRRYASAGHLPYFKSLIDKGNFSKMISPADVASASTWATVNTGLNPANHGYTFSHRQFKNRTYDIVRVYADKIKEKVFWNNISSNKLITLFDIPYSSSYASQNALVISAWGIESKSYETCTNPPELLNEIKKNHGNHPLLDWYHIEPKTKNELHSLLDNLEIGLKKRADITFDLLSRQKNDFFYLSVNESHWLGHFTTHITNLKHQKFTAELQDEFEPRIIKIYSLIDSFVSQLVDRNHGQPIIVFSNSGMGSNLSGRHLILDILRKMGLSPNTQKSITPAKRYGSFAAKKIETLIGGKNIALVKQLFPNKLWDRFTRKMINLGNNWSETLAFEIPCDYAGAIRINLEGREPNGKVKSEDYYKIAEQIKTVFLDLKHTNSGRPVVSDVIILKDKYKGSLSDDLADISIIWADEESVIDITSSTLGRFTGTLDDKRSGGHLPTGFLMWDNLDLSINGTFMAEDLAPTVLNILDQKSSCELDGQSHYQKVHAI